MLSYHRLKTTVVFFLALHCFVLGTAFCAEPLKKPVDEKRMWACWERIKKIGEGKELAKDASEEDQWEYWDSVRREGQEIFWELVDCEDIEAATAFYVERFGRDGCSADLRWMLANPLYGSSCTEVTFVNYTDLEDGSKTSCTQDGSTLEASFYKAIVNRMLKEPDFLRRYYRMIVWRRDGLVRSRRTASGVARRSPIERQMMAVIGNQHRGHIYDRQESATWHHAQLVVLICHALSRDDMLKKFDAKDTGKTRDPLYKWYLAHKKGLVHRKGEPRFVYQEEEFKKNSSKSENYWHILRQPEHPETPFPDCNIARLPRPKYIVPGVFGGPDQFLAKRPARFDVRYFPGSDE